MVTTREHEGQVWQQDSFVGMYGREHWQPVERQYHYIGIWRNDEGYYLKVAGKRGSEVYPNLEQAMRAGSEVIRSERDV
jgi:hypothetical protein